MSNLGFEDTDTILTEDRLFAPSHDVVENANILAYMKSKGFTDYDAFHQWSLENRFEFWEDMAKELHWFEPWQTTFQWTTKPFFQWFAGGKFNITYNCLDRHKDTPTWKKVAFYWEGDDGSSRTLTYEELYVMTNRMAKGLQNLGVKKGDRVAIYLPAIPEQVAALLAVARIGAVHSVVFGGFAASALRDRIIDAEAKVVITADGNYRGGKHIQLKKITDEAVAETPTIEKVIVVHRLGSDVPMQAGRDVYLHDLIADIPEDTVVPCEPMDSEDLLYILYTSGSTGKPKGIVHVQGGYAVGTYTTTKFVFDIKDGDIYWCTADIGWVTGHSYIVYGPLMNGVTSVLFEGTPTYPAPDRFWNIVEKYKVSIIYTSPTAIRGLMRFGEEWPAKHDLSSLRILGSVGEPINPEAWIWYRKNIGHSALPIMDTWWQTETGMILISPTVILPLKPGSATRPMPTIEADIVDRDGNAVGQNKGGFLIIRHPWPAQMRTIYKDEDRYRTYWETIPDVYFAGDAATKDTDGYFRVQGRVDDVIKVSGHRLGSMEIESSLVSHPAVAEAAAIGKPDPLKGEHVKVFVIVKHGYEPSAELEKELKLHVRTTVGALAVPEELEFTPSLPKTRSGKIMRRVIRAKELGEPVGDISTLDG
ncbi:acetyl-coenzyme A synthetase [Reticulibacter mediterranei]|uniref:Acetate--CoA ligase n=1 Tax=Reticulibacter mediterranei TaxID=2778369 RepID=A0A8J3IU19_9CHLR|nr:acetate--CoA ligase [Reticulibacter mediterranei]GHO96885.1 acetyl-coenzyme A synthetase [Reticulibacter mediterranei]